MSNIAFRLPFSFDVEKMKVDLAVCLGTQWPKHFNKRDYSGEWTSVSLRSASGKVIDIASVPDAKGYRDTPLMPLCNYLREVVAQFECEKETVRLLRLNAGSVIHEHKDPGAGYADGFFRIHIPITSNAETKFKVGGELLVMEPGQCWYADFSLPHSVRNDGTTDRIHLVIDCKRNEWSDELFRNCGYDFAEEERKKRPDETTLRRMIEELQRQGTPAALQLVKSLEQQLGKN